MCCCCVDYLLTSLTITTSTHTNYFDQIFKERGAKAPLSRPIIQSRFSLSTPCRLLFFRSGAEQNLPTPNEPTIITYPANLSTSFSTLFRLPALPPKFLPPKEPLIIQPFSLPSSLLLIYLQALDYLSIF